MKSDDPHGVYLMNMAQRELGAFMRAVTEVYGSEEAMLAAGDWLDEFDATDELPGFAIGDWRRITIAAAERLANRLSALGNRAAMYARGRVLCDMP